VNTDEKLRQDVDMQINGLLICIHEWIMKRVSSFPGFFMPTNQFIVQSHGRYQVPAADKQTYDATSVPGDLRAPKLGLYP
jgi:hypothetical protein